MKERLAVDLLERGLSLRDVGARLSWWELQKIIKFLPPDSHLARHVNPDGLLKHQMSNPLAQLLAIVHDRLEQMPFVLSGQAAKMDFTSTLDRILGGVSGGEYASRERAKKKLTPAQIRQRVMESMK